MATPTSKSTATDTEKYTLGSVDSRFKTVNDRLKYEARLRKISNSIHSADNYNEILIGMREQILSLYDAELVTIYLVDQKRKEIYSRVKKAEKDLAEIRLPIHPSSIAGYVASTGKLVNILDVYNQDELMSIDPDLSFDSSFDEKTGFKTRQVLAVPITFKTKLIGVIQLINKKSGKQFTVEDQRLLSDIAEILGIAFYNQFRLSKQKKTTRFDVLIQNNVISEKELNRAMEMARMRKQSVEQVLMDEYKVDRTVLGRAVARYFEVPFADLATADPGIGDYIKNIKVEYLKRSFWVPFKKENDSLVVAIDDPNDQMRTQEISQVLGTKRIKYHLALKDDIPTFIERYKDSLKAGLETKTEKTIDDLVMEMKKEGGDTEDTAIVETLDGGVSDNVSVNMVSKIIEDAHKKGASDIHIEPYGMLQDADVRFRTDGQCMDVLKIPKSHVRSVVSRIKILAGLDIAERRKPQDGKIKYTLSSGNTMELRVATVPTANENEDVVLRLLASSKPLPLEQIMPKQAFEKFDAMIRKPYGIALVVGPTGSGKTTTLHSALNYINTPNKKIWTAEDPVEITQYRLRQVQIKSKIDYTFANAMRAFLRADPDIIMVGEMRDRETMHMGIEASLTGHLVFSTLHTNSAPETIIRLIDMGIDPFNFADALLGILAQRLAPSLCAKCKKPYHPMQEEYDHLAGLYGENFMERVGIAYTDDLQLRKPDGCEICNHTGYKGRLGLFELLVSSDNIKRKIIQKATVDELRENAIQEGMSTLLQDGIQRIFEGKTDLKQVYSVCSR